MSTGVFDKETIWFFRTSVDLNLAFIAGSSKHGNVFLASVGCICEVAIYLGEKIFQDVNGRNE